jgi:hypothetical protein
VETVNFKHLPWTEETKCPQVLNNEAISKSFTSLLQPTRQCQSQHWMWQGMEEAIRVKMRSFFPISVFQPLQAQIRTEALSLRDSQACDHCTGLDMFFTNRDWVRQLKCWLVFCLSQSRGKLYGLSESSFRVRERSWTGLKEQLKWGRNCFFRAPCCGKSDMLFP